MKPDELDKIVNEAVQRLKNIDGFEKVRFIILYGSHADIGFPNISGHGDTSHNQCMVDEVGNCVLLSGKKVRALGDYADCLEMLADSPTVVTKQMVAQTIDEGAQLCRIGHVIDGNRVDDGIRCQPFISQYLKTVLDPALTSTHAAIARVARGK